MTSAASPSRWKRIAPAFTLMLMAPILAEVLPGATRLSSLFVLPIEVCVWGGGALLIREAVRRWQLGWLNMLLLAIVLSIAEECLIQQTSLAPMVLQLKGEVYARAYGVNYVYFLWALVYESVFVVFLPIHLVELMYPSRRDSPWVSRAGVVAVVFFFLVGGLLAWYSWTQIARPSVFKVPLYNPPVGAVLIAAVAICTLIFLSLGPFRNQLAPRVAPLTAPAPWVIGVAGGMWAVVWYGLVLLGFGIAPSFPPAIAVAVGVVLAAGILLLLPRWSASPGWSIQHLFGVIFGTMAGSMVVSFIGFLGSARMDLYFKILVDVLAVVLMVMLGAKVGRKGGTYGTRS
jgi:hypothetical protein